MLVVAFERALDFLFPPEPERQPEPRGLLSAIFDIANEYINPLPPILIPANVDDSPYEVKMATYKAFEEMAEATRIKYGY